MRQRDAICSAGIPPIGRRMGRRTERRTPQVDRAAQDLISDRDPKFDLTQQCKQSFPIIVVFPDPSMINKLIDCFITGLCGFNLQK